MLKHQTRLRIKCSNSIRKLQISASFLQISFKERRKFVRISYNLLEKNNRKKRRRWKRREKEMIRGGDKDIEE